MKIRKIQRDILDGIVATFPNLGLDKRAESFVELFSPYLPKESRILDIGGGWGFYSEPLERRGHHVTVLDVVKPGFQKAPVVISDDGDLPFEDKSFDVSTLITVLHHVHALENLILEAKRVTRQRVILVEDLYHHAFGRWWTSFRDRLYNFEFFGHPCNFKREEEWIEYFSSFGFSLVGRQKVYTWLAGLRILNGIFIFDVGDN